jgi:glyceraldehyde-3-phosphate dehydrogenase type I
MSKLRIGINGLGRIGRGVLREWYLGQQDGRYSSIEIVAVNNPGPVEPHIHLIQHDSLHRFFSQSVKIKMENHILQMGKKSITFFDKQNPNEIPWSDLGVDMVVDATGKFKDKKTLSQHLSGTVKCVMMCAPGKELDGTFVYGINHHEFHFEKHKVISNASCTTNCLAPIAQVLHENFKIKSGSMVTVHSYTGDQVLLDSSHKDLRRARSAAMNMIPTSTGAARALGLVIPSLAGKLDGYAVRVPTPDVSLVDLTVVLEQKVTAEMINSAMKEASMGPLKGVLGYCDEELVSMDFLGARESSVLDSKLTNVVGGSGELAKVVAWYDNEIGFSNRVLDMVNVVREQM